jgi:putative restriction endonuclease
MQQSRNNRTLIDYCERFAELKVSSTKQRGEAPYKPILLLSVIDLIAQGIINDNVISVSDELVDTFNKYWRILGNLAYQGGLHYPFFHLQSDQFWHIQFKDSFNGLQPKTVNKLKQAIEYAQLDDELFDILQNEFYRKEIIDTLIAVWFSASQKELEELLQINQTFQSEAEGEENEASQTAKRKTRLYKSLVRDSFFRKSVVHIYNYKCAFCGISVNRSLTQTIVDGAHIKPFAQFYDSKIDNGISFCKNHHWAFDRGWFAINDDYKIIVASDLQENSPNAKPMTEFNGEIIILPNLEQYHPRLEALQWHRQNIFRFEQTR